MVIREFWHAEFISALKTEPNPTFFEKNAKNKIKYLSLFFFVIFSKSFKQNCLKTMESCVLDGKKPNSAKMILINFLAQNPPDCHTILRAKIRGKNAYFCKSNTNMLIRVFWHAEFISALKTETNPTVFEKNARNKIKYLFFIIFDF